MDNALRLLPQLAIVVLAPPLLLGIANKTKAVFAGRRGPPLLQPYYDLVKLLQKGSVFSRTTTWLFRFGPVVGLATVVLAAMFLPLGHPQAPLTFTGDIVIFAYLLALGRFFAIVAALDTGSSFEGMGAAREAAFACLAELVMFFGLLVLAKVSSTLSLAGMLGGPLTHYWGAAGASLLLVLVSWFIVLLVENCRIPFDDPNTHLELTMIHEVMVLDHSGPALGLIVYAASIKLFVFAAMVVRLAVPLESGSRLLDAALFLAAVGLAAVAVGTVESIMARLRLLSVPNLLVGAAVLSAFGLVLTMVSL